MVLKSKRNKQFAVRHLENKKLQANCNLRKIHKQFGQHNTGEQHTGRQRSDSAEPYTIGFPKSNFRTFHINHCIKLKSFSVQQFFKNAAEVWASSPHLRSKSNCTMKRNKNLRENRKNRNCLQNQKVVMRDSVSGAIAIPRQAGDVPQPCRTGFEWFP